MKQSNLIISTIVILVMWCIGSTGSHVYADTSAPTSTVKLIFIHHSCGENWLSDSDGGLGIALRNNNYFVSDTNYGWDPDCIGDRTDIGHWWTWFCSANSNTILTTLYSESSQNSTYSRLAADPGGKNEIIMFKSCFPNSSLGGNPGDVPPAGTNPLRNEDCWSEYHTVGNAKGIYNDILTYFAAHQEKLFIAVTAPPQVTGDTNVTHAANARAFNNWLVNNWLDGYAYNNVAVFDFYNVLTSNGGNTNTNDTGETTGNHHRWFNGAEQHIRAVDCNIAAYGSGAEDSHPTSAGNQKATSEFVDLLNYYYNTWKGGSTPPLCTYQYYIPYFTSKSGCFSALAISNSSSSQSANISVTVYNTGSAVVKTETKILSAMGQEAWVVGSDTDVTGWMDICSDRPLTGLCFTGSTGSNNHMADIPFADAGFTSSHIPHVAQDNLWDTIIYICNPNSNNATVTLTYYSVGGQADTSHVYTIAANGSGSYSLADLIDSSSVSGGKIVISSTQEVVAFALYSSIKSGGKCYAGISAVDTSAQ